MVATLIIDPNEGFSCLHLLPKAMDQQRRQ